MGKLIKYCPKCGSKKLSVEAEPGQYNVVCLECNLYVEIYVFDEGDFDDIKSTEQE